MSKIFAASMIFSAMLGAAVWAGGDKSDGPTCCPPATTAPATQAAINTMCPVSHEAVDPAVTTTYEGKTIAFCCKDCIAQFQKDPQKYTKDLK